MPPKIRQLTYREGMALTRLTLLGTGNFNEKTAKLYSDFMLMTAHPGIGEDANLFFRNLSLGNLRGDYRFWAWRPSALSRSSCAVWTARYNVRSPASPPACSLSSTR